MKPSVKILSIILLQMVFANVALANLETVKIPSGKLEPFWLGASSNKKTNKKENKAINIASFEVMVSQVTVLQYEEFLNKQPQWNKQNISSLFSDASYLKALGSENKSAPVTWVSWFAAKAFCESVNMRLPTINEWEYIAQASETKKSAVKDELFLKRILDWYGEPQGGKLKNTKSIYKNIYGVWDMHGLVWEWVEDFNSSFVTGESREDTSFNKDMFCGAGGMNSADQENYAAFMRFAFRSSLKAKSSIWNLGFRCVR
jgi:formylglycine-generating enzyme required for sulfatase activity